MEEVNHGLNFGIDTFICFYKDGELVAIEKQNGKIERWTTEPQTRGLSLTMFGVDIPQKLHINKPDTE